MEDLLKWWSNNAFLVHRVFKLQIEKQADNMKWTHALPHMYILNLITNSAFVFYGCGSENGVEMKYIHNLLS